MAWTKLVAHQMTDNHEPARILVGCAGWNLRKEHAAAFPETGSHLERYAAVFPAVEINSSFYRPHRPETYARWADSVPDGFRFAVKVPRTITHDARLADTGEQLENFAREAGMLGDKLGFLLVQLPPKFGFTDEPARGFFGQLSALFGCPVAFEARHPSWFSEAATELLRERGVVRVIADPAAGQPGPHVPTSADHVYMRLHGAPRIYYSRYPRDGIAALRRQLDAQTAQGRTCWCIFDNTAAGESVPNALELMHG